MAFPAPPFSALMILFAVSLADFADTVEQLVNARLGNAELGGDLFHVVPHKLLINSDIRIRRSGFFVFTAASKAAIVTLSVKGT